MVRALMGTCGMTGQFFHSRAERRGVSIEAGVIVGVAGWEGESFPAAWVGAAGGVGEKSWLSRDEAVAAVVGARLVWAAVGWTAVCAASESCVGEVSNAAETALGWQPTSSKAALNHANPRPSQRSLDRVA